MDKLCRFSLDKRVAVTEDEAAANIASTISFIYGSIDYLRYHRTRTG